MCVYIIARHVWAQLVNISFVDESYFLSVCLCVLEIQLKSKNLMEMIFTKDNKGLCAPWIHDFCTWWESS